MPHFIKSQESLFLEIIYFACLSTIDLDQFVAKIVFIRVSHEVAFKINRGTQPGIRVSTGGIDQLSSLSFLSRFHSFILSLDRKDPF